MNAVDAALWAKLTGDATLMGLATGGVYHRVAPAGTSTPFVVFNLQDGESSYTQGRLATRDLVYLVKGIDEGLSGKVAGQIDERVNVLLTDVMLTVAGWTNIYLRRSSDVEYIEVADGVVYQHVGGLYDVMVT